MHIMMREWRVTENEKISVYFTGLTFSPKAWWVYQKQKVQKEEPSCSLTRVHTQTHTANVCVLFFVNRLDNSDYYHAFFLLGSFFFPPSICLPDRLSEENGIWWALAFLMTWLISGRLVVQFCVYVSMISFKHSNAKIHTDSHQLIPIKAISVNYLKTQLREVAPHSRKIPE